jgi:uncharacterized phage protein (TIGR02218 family)
MRQMTDGLRSHLAGTATTLCLCWRLQRRDGVVQGFTDHDRDIDFGGTRYEAASGFSASDMEASLGLNADSQEVAGALSSASISEEDIAADRYDGARVEIYCVNWQAPEERILLRTLHVGGIAREDGLFRAELRGASAVLDQTSGRRFQRACDADLGDRRCRVDVSAAQWRGSGSILSVRAATAIEVSGIGGFAGGHFRGGRITFTSGRNTGQSVEIAGHSSAGGTVLLELWKPPGLPLAAGNAFTVRAGCDKSHATCRDRFANQANFRGFPHMPGNDFALGSATSFTIFDGGALIP